MSADPTITDFRAAVDREDLDQARAIDVELGSGRCRECGCTERVACPGGCWWAEPGLCSTCAADQESIEEEYAHG